MKPKQTHNIYRILQYIFLSFAIFLGIISIIGTGGGGGGGSGDGGGQPVVVQASDSLSISITGLGDSELTTNQSPVTISGLTEPENRVNKVVFTNEATGTGGDALGTKEWSAIIDLKEGDNKLIFTVIANDGSTTEISTVLTYHPASTFRGSLNLSNDIMYVNESRDVTFTIGITSDTVSSVKLYATDGNGTVQSEEGTCKDDGILPDEIDKDGVYTIRKTLVSSETGSLCFRAGVTETGGERYYSENRCIWITSHYTNEDIKAAVDLADSAASLYEQALNQGKSAQEAAEAVVDQIISDPHIAEIGPTAGGGVAWVTTAGIFGGYHPTVIDQQAAESAQEASANQLSVYKASSSPNLITAAADDEEDEVQSNKAIIISPYIKHVPSDPNGDFGDKDNYYRAWPTIKNKKSCKLYAAEERINNVNLAWSIEAFKNLSDYGYIHICTHGFPFYSGVFNLWNEEWGPNKPFFSQVGLYTGILIPKKQDGTYDITGLEDDLKAKRTAIYTNGTLVILPGFIRHYIKDLPNSVVVLSACYSMYSYSLAYAFLQQGAGAVVAYTATAGIYDTGKTTKIIMEELYNGKTISEAVAKARLEYEYIVGLGNPNLRLSGKLKNGGFEKGVLSPWSKAGDGRVIPHLGSTQPTEGSNTGIISTGLGYTTSTGSIDQNFCMASDDKNLQFDWNFFSEEFMEYCGSQYQDSFSVKIYAFDPATGDIESEQLLFDMAIDDLCGMVGQSDVHFDKSYDGCEPSSGNDCKVWNTKWKSESIDISSFADKSVNLRFFATDIGDSVYDSAILIDNVRITK